MQVAYIQCALCLGRPLLNITRRLAVLLRCPLRRRQPSSVRRRLLRKNRMSFYSYLLCKCSNLLYSLFSSRRRKTDRVGKGLRHFSMKVCEKVKEKGTTTYNEVADELVEEVR